MEQNFNSMKSLALLVVAVLCYKNLNAQNVSANDTVRPNHFLAATPTLQCPMLHKDRASWNNVVNLEGFGLLERKRSQSRKIGKLLGYTGQAFLVSSIFVGKADKQFGKGIFLAGCTIAPIAFIFSTHGRRNTNSMATMVGGYESHHTPDNTAGKCLAAAWGGGLTGLMGGYALGGGVWYLVGAAGGTLTGMAAHC